MRALGPASVSSLLKVILDVFRVMLWVAAGGVSLAILVVLLFSFQPEMLSSAIAIDNVHIAGPWIGPMAAAVLFAIDLYLAGAMVIVAMLRRIFATLIAGDPFQPANVRRLRVIGLTLALLEISRYAAGGLAHFVLPAGLHYGASVSLTTWFAVLIIVVLAEVFREGARLRSEAELTI